MLVRLKLAHDIISRWGTILINSLVSIPHFKQDNINNNLNFQRKQKMATLFGKY